MFMQNMVRPTIFNEQQQQPNIIDVKQHAKHLIDGLFQTCDDEFHHAFSSPSHPQSHCPF
jgi:hypothetical protein